MRALALAIALTPLMALPAYAQEPQTSHLQAEAGTSSDIQAARWAFIQKMRDKGIITQVEVPGYLPRAYVGPTFYGLTFHQKQVFMDALLSYYFVENPKADLLIIKDGYTGKKIGELDKYGLRMK